MTPLSARCAGIAGVVLAVVLVTSGCSPTEPASTPDPVETPSASATPVAEPTEPTPLLDLACDELASSADLAVAIDAGIEGANPHESIRGAGADLPYTFAIEALGGIACQWSNGEFYNSTFTTNPDYRGVRISLLPTTAADAETYGYSTSGDVDESIRCESDGYFTCEGGVFVNDTWWIAYEADGVDGSNEADAKAHFFDLLSTAKTAVESAADVPAWTPPADTLAIGPSCPDIIPNATIESTFDTGTEIGNDADIGYGDSYGIYAAARAQLDANRCFWSTSDMAIVGTALWIPAGDWAWAESQSFDSVSDGLEPLEVTGGEAWLNCQDKALCVLDVVVGHNWIEANFYVGEDDVIDPAKSTPEAYTAIAQEMIDTVTAG